MYRAELAVDEIITPWSAAPPVSLRCDDSSILLDVVAVNLRDGRDQMASLSMLSAGLRVARSCLSTADWQAYCRMLRDHPLGAIMRQDPLTARCANRPRGYAGDAVMLDMIYGEPILAEALAATTPLGRVINQVVNNVPATVALRERRAFMAQWVDAAAAARPAPTILTVAAGHLREADDSAAWAAGQIGRWVALDQDAESCAEIAARQGSQIEIMPESIMAILKSDFPVNDIDLAYAAGLYDYLPHRLAARLTRRLVGLLRPGGRFCFANYAAGIWDAGYMESAMDWSLILRSPADMQAIAASAGPDVAVRHWSGVYGAIHYCEITRL